MKLLTGTVMLAIAVLVSAPPSSAQVREADVTGGRVAGAEAHGIVSFKGIPFAAPPVGALRWKAPQRVQPWSGVKQADSFGPGCVQASSPYTQVPSMSEDCLYLNVWTPAKAANDRLPVMVWIYGGGFVGGSTAGAVTTGERLASKGVIVVSVAYRVGPLGYLAHPGLSAESKDRVSGNYGVLDLIAGLQWVKKNIAVFGGDSGKVTIFGESAGGIAVSMLSASP